MKRAVLTGAALMAAFILPGCPVYPRDEACFHDEDCPVGSACYSDGYCAPASGGRGGQSSIAQCDEPGDCRGVNQTCGSDGRCHTGSCQVHKCVRGFVCDRVDQVWTCVRGSSGTGGAGGRSGAGGSYGLDADVPDHADTDAPETGSGGVGGNDAAVDGTVSDAASDAAGGDGSSDDAAAD